MRKLTRLTKKPKEGDTVCLMGEIAYDIDGIPYARFGYGLGTVYVDRATLYRLSEPTKKGKKEES